MSIGGLGRTRQSGKVRGAGSAADSDQSTTEVQEKGAGKAAGNIGNSRPKGKEIDERELAGYDSNFTYEDDRFEDFDDDHSVGKNSDIDTSSIDEAKSAVAEAKDQAANTKQLLKGLLDDLSNLSTLGRFENFNSRAATPRSDDASSVQTAQSEIETQERIDELQGKIDQDSKSIDSSTNSDKKTTLRGRVATNKVKQQQLQKKAEQLKAKERRERTKETYNAVSKSNASKAGSTNSKESASQSDDLLSILESNIKDTHTEKSNKKTMKLRRAMRKARSILKHEGKPNKKMLAFLQKQGVISPEQFAQFSKQV